MAAAVPIPTASSTSPTADGPDPGLQDPGTAVQGTQSERPSEAPPNGPGVGKRSRGRDLRCTRFQARDSPHPSVARSNPHRDRRRERLRVSGFPLPKPLRSRTARHRNPMVRATVLRPQVHTCKNFCFREVQMSTEHKPSVRCAIYTRKSSEEGLEQSFNSLDAQREACQAFILSQRQEGWKALPDRYDDGGYSGGNLQRPALQRLLEDIEAHKVDTIVVYKVDRLTRSLADFAKIVEALDARGVSFVSVTQQFNTTSSMGRLTLNVLLSFAQFEREVTGERIRDKIAASKRKGMWMGGVPPLGYDLKERKLIVNPKEAQLVCDLYRLYLELGCVSKLKTHLDREGIKSKVRTGAAGNRSGGAAYSRGALYEILKNRIYLGEIVHRDQVYAGEHKAHCAARALGPSSGSTEERQSRTQNWYPSHFPKFLGRLTAGRPRQPLHSLPSGKERQAVSLLRLSVGEKQRRGHRRSTFTSASS